MGAPPPPTGFIETFEAGGSRVIERLHANTEILCQWIEAAGGADLLARRREASASAASGVAPRPPAPTG